MKTTLISSQEKYPFLRELFIQDINPGSCAGPDDWSSIEGCELLDVVAPIDGSVVAKVALASLDDYEHVVKTAQEAFLKWRLTPAPVRGQIVREVG